MFIKLTNTDGSKVVLNLYSIHNYEIDMRHGGTLIRITDNVSVRVKESLEEVDALLRESYVFVKEIK